MQLSIRADIRAAERALVTLKKQVPYAAWLAKKNTAFKMRKAVQGHMRGVFKTTSRFTLTAPYVMYPKYSKYKNSADKTIALDLISQYPGLPGNRKRQRHYLWDHIHGQRTPTGFEMRLKQSGVLPDGMFAVRTRYLNLYFKGGKLNKGFYQKVLSQLKAAGSEAGWNANATNSARSRRKRRNLLFFVNTKGRPRGIWMRTRSKSGSMAVPIFIFVDSARYKKRFKFYEVSKRTVDRHWRREFEKAISHAIKTSK